jgi:hypothetical protein
MFYVIICYLCLTLQIVRCLTVAMRRATYCLQGHPIRRSARGFRKYDGCDWPTGRGFQFGIHGVRN